MIINSKKISEILVISPEGRLDAYGASVLDETLSELIKDDDLAVVFDLEKVPYLSSGGIRTFLKIQKILKEREGKLCLCNIKPYPMEVLEMAGFDQIFSVHSTRKDAIESHITPQIDSEPIDWDALPKYEDEIVSLTLLEASHEDSSLKVVGDIHKVLYAQIEEDDIYSRKFSETEYSIGLGGLGEDVKDYIGIMGEMITIGGTMVWLPTDGHDTPDFLIPKKDTGKVTIHTGFNVALDGRFNDMIFAESKSDAGFSVDELYASIFKMARKQRPSFKGIVSIAMQADIAEFYSSGVNISPIKKLAPKNREMIMHEDNIASWMNINTKPRYKGETMVSFGVGVDLKSDLSSFDEDVLGSLFYLHPANIGNKRMLLHNHAVVFKHMPLEKTSDLDGRIREIVNNGDFMDMRHLLDNTRIQRAVMGVSYISDILFEKEQYIEIKGECDGWNDIFEEITRKMHPDSCEIVLTPLTGGYSGSMVFRVNAWDRSGREEMPFVLKLGSWSEISDEVKGYEDHVKRYIQNNATQIIDHKKIGDYGGILYNFVGINAGESQIISFEDYYFSHKTADVIAALEKLFRNVLRGWYGQPKLKDLFLYEEYDSFFQYDLIKKYARENFNAMPDEKYIELPLNLGRSVNPLYFVENVMPERRSQAVSAYETSTHGDLNLRNVLMDDNLNMWLIDFAFTRHAHILRDIAKLETALKIECVDIDSEGKLKDVLEFERQFLDVKSLSDIPRLPRKARNKYLKEDFEDSDVIKAFSCVQKLRGYANVITLLDEDISQYFLALFPYTLMALAFVSVNDYMKKYAWISSSMISGKLI
ncbi:MAG: anti-sigma factor antagonist [Euryarchaeota archaeon]|nr:anti-sigma factor antagonist [Euryarchaeota archaeon]